MFGFMGFTSGALLSLYVGHYHTAWHIVGLSFCVIMALVSLSNEGNKKIAAYSHLDGEEREIVHAEVYRNQEREDLILKIFGCSALLLIGLFFKLKQVCPIENLFNC